MTPSAAAPGVLPRADGTLRRRAVGAARAGAGDPWRALARACGALSEDAPGRLSLERALEILRESAGASLAALYLGAPRGAELRARAGPARSPQPPSRWCGRLDEAAGDRAVALELGGAGASEGVLVLWHARASSLPRTWRDALAEGGPALGAALARRRELEALRSARREDPLTGVLNARHFAARLDDEVERARRYGVALGLILADVDHMEALNARYSADSGDRALAEAATLLCAQARRSDAVGRTGGDELAWLLPEADSAAAAACGERLRAVVAAHVFPRVRRLSVSIGAASLPRLAADAPQLRDAAERSLTLAKKSGRNRVGHSAPPAVH